MRARALDVPRCSPCAVIGLQKGLSLKLAYMCCYSFVRSKRGSRGQDTGLGSGSPCCLSPSFCFPSGETVAVSNTCSLFVTTLQ